jgi:NDP-sugar pyrophosphorylase family protein
MNLSKLWCFFPVGGKAKRLRPLTYDISKPCVRFLNRPLIEFSMATLAEQGIRNFIFGEYGYTNYVNLFDQYGEGIGFSAKYNIKPRVHIKHQPNLDDCGSADSYRLNVEYYNIVDPVIVVQGDSLFDIDLQSLIRSHEKTGAVMTIALARVDKVKDYGIADLDKDMKIKRFVEKPDEDDAPSSFANAGIYLLSPKVREIVGSDEVNRLVEERNRFDFGYDLIPYLVDNGFPVYGFKINSWYDVGNPLMYLRAMDAFLKGKSDIRVLEERILPNQNIWVQGYSEDSIKRREEIIKKYNENRLYLHDSILIGRHTRIGDFSKIQDSNVDNFCILGEHVNLERSAVMDGAKVGDYASIADSILGRKVVVESSRTDPTNIDANSVIGNCVRIRKGCKLIGTKVNPGLTIPPGMKYENRFLNNYEDVVELAS